MPKIPLYHHQPKSTPTQNIRLNPGMRDAEFTAAAHVGAAVAQVGDAIADFAFKKQALVNKGILAEEDRLRMETAGQVEDFMLKNQGKPETWEAFEQSAWKEYERGRMDRIKKGNWAPVLVQQDEQAFKDYRTRTQLQFRQERSRAEIMQANSRLEARAQTLLRSGSYDGFVNAINEMDLFPADRERKLREGLEQGTYDTATAELDGIDALPPAQAITAYKDFVAQLTAKDDSGNHTYLEFEHGGLSLGGRVKLENTAAARMREARRAINQHARNLVEDVRQGRATEAEVDDALKAGMLDEQTAVLIAPKLRIAIAERKEAVEDKARVKQERAERAEEKAQRSVEKLAANAESLRERIESKDDVSFMEIEREFVKGRLDSTAAKQLSEMLKQRSTYDQMIIEGEFDLLSKRIDGAMAHKLLRQTGPRNKDYVAALREREPTDEEYQELRRAITNAKLSQPTRLILVDKLLGLKLADLWDKEEAIRRTWGGTLDRKLSDAEHHLRKEMLDTYRGLLPSLGDANAGNILFAHEGRIRDFFSRAKGGERTEAEIKQFREQLVMEAHSASATEMLAEAFGP